MADSTEETPLQKHRRLAGVEPVRTTSRIHKFFHDYQLVHRQLAPQQSALEQACWCPQTGVFDAADDLAIALAEREPGRLSERTDYFKQVVLEARTELRVAHERTALHRVDYILKRLENDYSSETANLRFACAEVIRDAGQWLDYNADAIFADAASSSWRLCQLAAARNETFRLLRCLFTTANIHRGGLRTFAGASSQVAERIYRAGCDIAARESERHKSDIRYKMLHKAFLRHKIQLLAWDTPICNGRVGLKSELQADVEEMMHLAEDAIGTPAAIVSAGFAAALYWISLARYLDHKCSPEHRLHLDNAERALSASDIAARSTARTPSMELALKQGWIELALATGNIAEAKHLMDSFYEQALPLRFLYHIGIWDEWQDRLQGNCIGHSAAGLRYVPLVSYFLSEPVLSKEFIK